MPCRYAAQHCQGGVKALVLSVVVHPLRAPQDCNSSSLVRGPVRQSLRSLLVREHPSPPSLRKSILKDAKCMPIGLVPASRCEQAALVLVCAF